MRAPQKFTVVVSCALWCRVLGRGHGTGVQGAPRPSPVAPNCWGARFWGPGLCSAPPPARRRAAGGRVAAGKQVGGVAAAGQGEPPAPLTRAAALGLLPGPVPAGFVPQRQQGRGLLPFPPRKAAFSPCWRDWQCPPGWGGSSARAGGGSRQQSRSISQQSLAAEPCSPPLPAEQLNCLWLPPGDQEPPTAPAAVAPVLGGGFQPSGSGAHSSSTSPQLRYHVPVRITCYNKPTSPN